MNDSSFAARDRGKPSEVIGTIGHSENLTKSAAATTCEHGYTGDERDSCACPTCSEQQLLAKVKELTALLREFEALPVRRLTNETAVYERSPLDGWRARCGKAVHGWL